MDPDFGGIAKHRPTDVTAHGVDYMVVSLGWIAVHCDRLDKAHRRKGCSRQCWTRIERILNAMVDPWFGGYSVLYGLFVAKAIACGVK